MSDKKSTTSSTPSTKPKPLIPVQRKPMTLEEYQKKKDRQLKELEQRNREDQRIWRKLGEKTREEQRAKAKSMTQGNPLAFDEASNYERNMHKLRQKYIQNGSP